MTIWDEATHQMLGYTSTATRALAEHSQSIKLLTFPCILDPKKRNKWPSTRYAWNTHRHWNFGIRAEFLGKHSQELQQERYGQRIPAERLDQTGDCIGPGRKLESKPREGQTQLYDDRARSALVMFQRSDKRIAQRRKIFEVYLVEIICDLGQIHVSISGCHMCAEDEQEE